MGQDVRRCAEIHGRTEGWVPFRQRDPALQAESSWGLADKGSGAQVGWDGTPYDGIQESRRQRDLNLWKSRRKQASGIVRDVTFLLDWTDWHNTSCVNTLTHLYPYCPCQLQWA